MHINFLIVYLSQIDWFEQGRLSSQAAPFIMKKHTKIYLEAFGLDEGDYIPCEITGAPANDIHHIESRGMGGDPKGNKDRIENLMAVTRESHIKYGDDPKFIAYLYTTHKWRMDDLGVTYDKDYIEHKIQYYKFLNG